MSIDNKDYEQGHDETLEASTKADSELDSVEIKNGELKELFNKLKGDYNLKWEDELSNLPEASVEELKKFGDQVYKELIIKDYQNSADDDWYYHVEHLNILHGKISSLDYEACAKELGNLVLQQYVLGKQINYYKARGWDKLELDLRMIKEQLPIPFAEYSTRATDHIFSEYIYKPLLEKIEQKGAKNINWLNREGQALDLHGGLPAENTSKNMSALSLLKPKGWTPEDNKS